MDREEISPNLNNNAADPSGADGSSSRHRSVRVKRGRTDLASFHTSDSVFDEFEVNKIMSYLLCFLALAIFVLLPCLMLGPFKFWKADLTNFK